MTDNEREALLAQPSAGPARVAEAIDPEWLVAPFPWHGGKTDAAPAVWRLLGDPEHYMEPFFGSGAVLLNRPHPANRTYYSETVNDFDGLLCNAWRSIQLSPEETAEHCSYPVS